MDSTCMHTAYQHVVDFLGDILAFMIRREREVWSLHETGTDILAIATRTIQGTAAHQSSLVPGRGWRPRTGNDGRFRGPGQGIGVDKDPRGSSPRRMPGASAERRVW